MHLLDFGTSVSSDKTASDHGMASAVNNYVAIEDASIKLGSGVASKNIKSEHHKVGPFSVKWSGSITSIEVTYEDGTKVTNPTIEQNGRTFSSISSLSQNTKFYIINDLIKEVKSLRIKVHQSHEIYGASYTVWIGRESKCVATGYSVSWAHVPAQNLIQHR